MERPSAALTGAPEKHGGAHLLGDPTQSEGTGAFRGSGSDEPGPSARVNSPSPAPLRR